MEKGGKEREERERTILPYESSFVLPPVMLLCFVYHEKIPLMLQPHQTADQVHEWHLSEPRVNPMIRGNLPKGLCSWEKCLLQRGMQKIPGRTGPPLLAGQRYSGANKGTQKMGSRMQRTFEENVQRPPWNIHTSPPSLTVLILFRPAYTQNTTILGLHNRNVSLQQQLYSLSFSTAFSQLKLLLT